MEDSKDKVRRNLVVFCSVIVVAWYLGIRLETPEISILGIIKYKVPHPEKIQYVLLVLLIYLLYRFLVLVDTINTFRSIKSSWINTISSKHSKHLEWAISEAARNKKSMHGDIQITQLIHSPLIPDLIPIERCQFNFDPIDNNLYWRMFAAVNYRVDFYFPEFKNGTIEKNNLERQLLLSNVLLDYSSSDLKFHINAIIRLSFFRSMKILLTTVTETFFSWEFSELAFPTILVIWSLKLLITSIALNS